MAKPRLLFRGPVLTRSGYGVHARQLLRALILSERFDISVSSVRWGETPFIFEEDPFLDQVRELSKKFDRERATNQQYDASVQVTIASEFQRLASFNVGVTAGIEVDRVSPAWIQAANEHVELVIVPSQHSMATFAGVVFQSENGDELKLTKPIRVCPEGVHPAFNTGPLAEDMSAAFDGMPPFNFICTGLGLSGTSGEDRKNVSTLVRWFCERFKDDAGVGLILKVSVVNSCMLDFEAVKSRILRIKHETGTGPNPPIRVIHGNLTESQMAGLYKHPQAGAFVTLTHGEGFGLPIIEAAACGLPVVATDWSGHLDFLTVDGKKLFVPVAHELATVPDSAVWKGVIEPGSRWANPLEQDAKHKLLKVILSPDVPRQWAQQLAAHVSERYSLDRTGRDFVDLVSDAFGQFSQARPKTEADAVSHIREKLGITPETKSLLFTMPMSAGDVYLSTGVLAELKKKHPGHRVFFATEAKYFSLLKENPDIDGGIIGFEPWMTNVPFCERVFDLVFTPNLAIQMNTSNWVRGGRGRLLADEIAHHCDVSFGTPQLKLEPVPGLRLPDRFVCFNPSPMRGQWEARAYHRWQEVVNNVAELSGLPVVQVGQDGDPSFDGVVDLRGRTADFNQLGWVISKAACMLGVDTATMHMAAGMGVPVVSVFGSSYSTSTGPSSIRETADGKRLAVLLDAPNRGGCEKACYKHQCSVDRENPCVNEVSPRSVVGGVLSMLAHANIIGSSVHIDMDGHYKEHRPKIAGYTTVLNATRMELPFTQSIQSMLGFCDEVVVVDGGSTDGTRERLTQLAEADPRVRIIDRPWDPEEPAMDGMQKAYARAMVSVGPNDFCWQQDADEVVHPDDYQKVRDLVWRFPRDVDVIHLPVIELWDGDRKVRTDRHAWKWRMSRNSFRVTHGINAAARVSDEKTGRTYAKKGMSDGCEYVDVMNQQMLPHRGFWTNELENMRRADPVKYGREMNRLFAALPSVFHYSWADLSRKVRNFRDFWDRQWDLLHGESKSQPRFPGVITDEQVAGAARVLREHGGEHGPTPTFELERASPSSMVGWVKGITV